MRGKQQGEQIKIAKNGFERELAIYTQKLEFQGIEISELRTKNKELNESYQRYLENVHSDAQGIEETYANKTN